MSGLHNPRRGVYVSTSEAACRRAITLVFLLAVLCNHLSGFHATLVFPQDSFVNDIQLPQVLDPPPIAGDEEIPSHIVDFNDYSHQINSVPDEFSQIHEHTIQESPYSSMPGEKQMGEQRPRRQRVRPRIEVRQILIPRSTTTFKYIDGPAATTPTVIFATVCENSNLPITCTGTKKINILSAAYGRSDGTTCCPPGASLRQCPSTVQCLLTTSTNVVTTACQARPTCNVPITNPAFGGVDPCPGIYKYLKVSYTCQ